METEDEVVNDCDTAEQVDTHVDQHISIPPTIVCGPPDMLYESWLPIMQMSQRIAADPDNRVLDPPSFNCRNNQCCFCTGDLMGQRFALMQRLFQLNATLTPLTQGLPRDATSI